MLYTKLMTENALLVENYIDEMNGVFLGMCSHARMDAAIKSVRVIPAFLSNVFSSPAQRGTQTMTGRFNYFLALGLQPHLQLLATKLILRLIIKFVLK
jgi:hypothetical protein